MNANKNAWDSPKTVAEASSYARTSTSADVAAFVADCAAHDSRLVPLPIGSSTEGRDVTLVLAADPPVRTIDDARRDGRIVALVMANIHAGEVEGKEAVQEILREIVHGDHDALLRDVIVAFIPNYNPDGNDRIDRRNRPDQAGPIEGVGQRPNGQNLDLNRDYLKAEAPETEALIRTVRALDAAIVVDLHTTDGSYHGFDLTYAGPLHPGTDPEILAFERQTFLPALRLGMRARGFATFDYGNWLDEDKPGSGWVTFEHKPRFGNSYFGLRNRLTLLSEAYSHDVFEKRIASTKALVLEGLTIVAERRGRIRELIAGADARAARLSADGARLPTTAEVAQSDPAGWIPVGSVREEKDPVTGLVRQFDTDVATPVRMPVFAWFDGVRHRSVPPAWVIESPSGALLRVLEIHGIAHSRLPAETECDVRVFQITKEEIEPRPFQGHRLATFHGSDRVTKRRLPVGALVIPSDQPLARLCFTLLEPESDDGLGTWGILGATADADGTRPFAVMRCVDERLATTR